MLGKLRSKLTFANVAASLALFLSLSTGAAYAANTVFSTDIVNGEVKTVDLANSAVTGGKIAANSVSTGKLANSAVTSTKIVNLAVQNADLHANAVNSPKILNGSVHVEDLGANSVGTDELQDGAVTSAKVLDDTAGGGLGAADLASDSVGFAEIQTDGVQASEIADNSIDSGEIVDFGLSNQDIGVLFAEVNANGTLANSSGAGVSVLKLGGSGGYEVDFSRNIVACTAVATVGPSGAGSALGEVNVADRGGNAEAVFVDTNTSSGTAADLPFRLIVVC